MKKQPLPTVKDFQNWVYEEQSVSQMWRQESWNAECYNDGAQWSDEAYADAIDAGIDPVTSNRIFPVVNLICGYQVLNKRNIVAKGRTQRDSDVEAYMNEGIQFVLSQYAGQHLISRAFRNQAIPGIGWVAVGHNPDPRREAVMVQYRDWKDVGWDPFGDPWLDINRCRYVHYSPWVDLDDLVAYFPEKANDLDAAFNEYSGGPASRPSGLYYDEAYMVEDLKSSLARNVHNRKRCRPSQMYYATFEEAAFAKFPDGYVVEITPRMSASDIYQAVSAAAEILVANVRKVRTATFLGDVLLHEGPSPFNHDEYPYASFVGYLDRFGMPYGVPRQLMGENDEINRRRSMALALLRSKQVIIEEGAIPKEVSPDHIYEEANKLNTFIVVRDGKMNAIKIGESKGLVQQQYEILMQSEREIQQISGANDEMAGYKGQAVSGIAIEKRVQQGNTITASLFDNYSMGLKRLGELITAGIQGKWTGEKVLRVTDRITNKDKFVELNKRQFLPDGSIAIVNNITQGKYDIEIAEAPLTDTIREQNINLLIEWVKKSPPEVVPHILTTAMELSNIPNKDQILAKLRPLMGMNPADDDLSQEQLKQRVMQELEAQKQAQAEQAKLEQEAVALDLENKRLENDLVRARIDEVRSNTKVKEDKEEREGFKTGYDMQQKANAQNRQPEVMEGMPQNVRP